VGGRSASTPRERLRFGILGAADIARRALIPAIAGAGNAELAALASRDLERGRGLFGGRVVSSYESLLADPEVDAVYIPLPNGLHKDWTIRALAAGKHVLCEKPLATNQSDAMAMAAAAHAADRLLMEAVMYRFHPRIQDVVGKLRERPPEEIWASFGFPLREPGNIRFDPGLGGGALLDVGTYTISLARWIYGEPDWVEATGRVEEVDMTVSMTLGFAAGARAHLFASFDTPEVQELHAGDLFVDKPFTAWRDPVDPYQVMVEEFSAAALRGLPAPLSLEDSIANLRVVDAVRRSLDTGDRHHLAEAGEGGPPVTQ
jgi:D-xylose 1-dehydrogenase (NADP+, D-xylono-1,5-lactone-forming)